MTHKKFAQPHASHKVRASAPLRSPASQLKESIDCFVDTGVRRVKDPPTVTAQAVHVGRQAVIYLSDARGDALCRYDGLDTARL
jgi:hypothetical protein